ncbi:uncharacterized protein RJT21DRAFT_121739 [Scheffersomyces amazonensis]|uniref:uncharacterized protein n=1 Tax=Scheffersomyces amazonensis TaxID=1078765 RepID=UPI00315CFF84
MAQSLLEVDNKQVRYSHLKTGIPSLDEVFIHANLGIRNRIHDFQSTAGSTASYTITISLIVSHLQTSTQNKIIIIDTLSRFPFRLLTDHPHYDSTWIENNQIIGYTCDTFAKLLSMFTIGKLQSQVVNNSTLIIINDFHETVDLYKYELSSIYEEYLLKNHIEIYETIVSNKEQVQLSGTKSPLPEIPYHSDLLTTNIITKFESHLFGLLNSISSFCFRFGSLCILLGHLDSKYENYRPNIVTSTQSFNSSQSIPSSIPLTNSNEGSNFDRSFTKSLSSGGDRGRIILSPFMSTVQTVSNGRNQKSFDAFISMRLIFYKDWYHKSEEFIKNCPNLNDASQITLQKAQVRFIHAVKIIYLNSLEKNSPTIYFDYDSIYYHLDDDYYEDNFGVNFTLLDLSEHTGNIWRAKNVEDQEKFASRESSRLNSDISRTPSTPIPIPVNQTIPSSPEILDNHSIQETETELINSYASNRINVISENITHDDESIVEESEDELMGSVLLTATTH